MGREGREGARAVVGWERRRRLAGEGLMSGRVAEDICVDTRDDNDD